MQEFHKAFLDAKCSSGDNQEYVFEFLVGQSSPSSQQYRGNIAEIFWVWQKRKVGDTPTRDLQQWQDIDEEGCHGDQSQEVTELVQSSSSSVPPYPGEGFGTPGGLPILKVILIKNNNKIIKRHNEVIKLNCFECSLFLLTYCFCFFPIIILL